jgi:uncharacterized repeat protein (TIGR01451 family)
MYNNITRLFLMGLHFLRLGSRRRRLLPSSLLSLLLASLLVVSNTQAAPAVISGYVFHDYNANGQLDVTADFKEPYAGGVTVTAYPNSGAVQTTTTAQGSGTYSFSGLNLPVRIEFSGLEPGSYSVQGSESTSSVQFYTAATSSANFGITSPDTYYSDANPPTLFSSVLTNGDQSADNRALIGFPYDAANSNESLQTIEALDKQVGSIYGLAYQKSTNRLFASAYVKRHVGLGSGGIDAIYVTTLNSKTPQLFVNLKADLGIDVGMVGSNADRQLGNTNTPNIDAEGYSKTSKFGIGDLDISQDDQTLYLTNLYDKKLYAIKIDADHDPATKPSPADVTRYNLPDSACGGGSYEWQPFAIGIKNDSIFVGGVCSQTLHALVYKLTPSVNANFTQVLDANLNYTKGYVFQDCKEHTGWYGWLPADSYPEVCANSTEAVIYPQPLLVDINFANDDSMILGLRDRFGDQSGANNYDLSGTSVVSGMAGGDILRAAYQNGTYVLENNGTVGNLTSTGAGNNQGPGGGEFYYQDGMPDQHYETGMGSLVTYLPLNQTIYSRMDVYGYWQGGFGWADNDNGMQTKVYEVYGFGGASFLGKASGLGDIEMATPPSPTEIGNRVWLDTNKNGIQDADEAGIDNVSVSLDCGTGQTATTVTANGGNYLFSNATSGNATFMQPPMSCTVKIDSKQTALSAYQLTKQDADNNKNNDALTDLRDSDAAVVNGQASITVNLAYAGANNHSLDFGFTEASKIDLRLSKLVSMPQALPNAPAHVLVPGDTLTYTLVLTNEGANPATNVQIKDLLPSRLQYLEHNGDGQYDNQTGLWSIVSIAAGASATLTIKATIN